MRAALAVLAHRGTECLPLDEPANQLDIESLQTLEAALEGRRARWLSPRMTCAGAATSACAGS
jgi:DNA repair exonuclease SbcCD ATPase subunit